MLEENAVACTKIIEARFAVGCMEEAQSRTLPVTGFEPQTFAALTGKSFLLEPTEIVLRGAIEHLRQAVCAYVT